MDVMSRFNCKCNVSIHWCLRDVWVEKDFRNGFCCWFSRQHCSIIASLGFLTLCKGRLSWKFQFSRSFKPSDCEIWLTGHHLECWSLCSRVPKGGPKFGLTLLSTINRPRWYSILRPLPRLGGSRVNAGVGRECGSPRLLDVLPSWSNSLSQAVFEAAIARRWRRKFERCPVNHAGFLAATYGKLWRQRLDSLRLWLLRIMVRGCLWPEHGRASVVKQVCARAVQEWYSTSTPVLVR